MRFSFILQYFKAVLAAEFQFYEQCPEESATLMKSILPAN